MKAEVKYILQVSDLERLKADKNDWTYSCIDPFDNRIDAEIRADRATDDFMIYRVVKGITRYKAVYQSKIKTEAEVE